MWIKLCQRKRVKEGSGKLTITEEYKENNNVEGDML